jgi:hypothetical protein
MKTYNKYFIPKWYYYATPLFILLDYLAGINVRVSALDAMPLYKNIYYGCCILCGIYIYIFPNHSPVVALCESAINILMMILLLFLPYVRLIMQEDILNADWQLADMFDVQRFSNILIVAYIAILAFRANISELAEGFVPTKKPPIQPPPSDTDQRPPVSAS